MLIDYRVLDLNITSAEGIKGVLSFTNFFFKSKVYAAVSVDGTPSATQETPLAKYFGKNPVWNCSMRFHLEESKLQENALTLKIKLKRRRTFGRDDEDIAEASIPLRNLFNGNENVTNENCSSSFMLSKSGGLRGLVYFSYCFSRTYNASDASDDGATVAPPLAFERPPLAHRSDLSCGVFDLLFH
ncbi:protein SRC2 homolog [Cucumis sativus]|uniref:C2 domain-containing protein n=1 Tax=Cucumis sativus TaxID=3659 RepID=A0A0A0LIU2_CUCSA|nr:protein SRC2 homolog [Cucumis sativus]KGN60949.1 hypothetical protein Csa_021167 [Cucumis sativus]